MMYFSAFAFLLAMSGPPAPATVCPPSTWAVTLLTAHRARYPLMQLDDALKLLQQATLGSEHAATDSTEAARWMTREWATLGAGPAEPLVDTLGAGGRFVRINLRSWRDAGGSAEALLTAFVRTGRDFRSDPSALRCVLQAFDSVARKGSLPWRADSVAAHVMPWAQQGYSALDHSVAYEKTYAPAYRVIALPLVAALLATLRR